MVQPLLAAEPAFLITTWAWNPPGQELVTEYAHDSELADGGLLGGGLLLPLPAPGSGN
jgi:hypothetical protein